MIAEFCEQEIINSWSSYPGNTSRLNPGDKSNEYLVSVKYYEKIIEQLQKHLNYKVVFLLDISNKIYTYKRDVRILNNIYIYFVAGGGPKVTWED